MTAFGAAAAVGGTTLDDLSSPLVGAAATPNGLGYWVVAADGGVFAYGDAAFEGSAGGSHLNAPVVGMAATPDGGGYWLVAADGGVFAYGDAAFEGSAGGIHLNAPVVGMAATPDGGGYWLVAADGGVFAYGDAVFAGSMGGRPLNQPIVGMAATPDRQRLLDDGGGRRDLCLRERTVRGFDGRHPPQRADRRHGRAARRGWLLAGRRRRWGLQLRGRPVRGIRRGHADSRLPPSVSPVGRADTGSPTASIRGHG